MRAIAGDLELEESIMYENPNKISDPEEYINLVERSWRNQSRRFTTFVQRLFAVSLALFLGTLLLGRRYETAQPAKGYPG